ncbi:hypothetical protein BJ999_004307 [Actinomadura citrea]|uniref:Uncharacterized protein n=1 Tax=Actinomadura citrea TaxID=46158 RepID=A0A7Y9GCM7_9ACTN|nr:hypothetical protein [Actinomadura citrea]
MNTPVPTGGCLYRAEQLRRLDPDPDVSELDEDDDACGRD